VMMHTAVVTSNSSTSACAAPVLCAAM
jgi:hypothetical protein